MSTPAMSQLAGFEGWTFRTLDQGHLFTLVRVADWGIYYERATGTRGYIRPATITRAMARLGFGGELELKDLHDIIKKVDPLRSETDPSCVAAVLASISDVRYCTRPIRLILGRFETEPGYSFRPTPPVQTI